MEQHEKVNVISSFPLLTRSEHSFKQYSGNLVKGYTLMNFNEHVHLTSLLNCAKAVK